MSGNGRRVTLFVAGDERNSSAARRNLERVLARESEVDYEVVDVLSEYSRALELNVLVTPALIVEHGQEHLTIIGDLRDEERLIEALAGTREKSREQA